MKLMRIFFSVVFVLLLAACNKTSTEKYSREIGVYPGNPDESFAPEMVADNNNYRNVAAFKAAYHSSSYDYNLTAQLVTDGIISDNEPATINVSTQNGDLKKNEREWLFDDKTDSKYVIEGSEIYLQLDLNNMNISADKMVLCGDVVVDDKIAKGYEIVVSASSDGINWDELDHKKGDSYIGSSLKRDGFFFLPPPDAKNAKLKENVSPVVFKYDYMPTPEDVPSPFSFGQMRMARTIEYEVPLKGEQSYSHYKFAFNMAASVDWAFNTWDFYKGDELLCVLPSNHFNSAWESASADQEWLYVDLGAPATYDKINLHWVNKAVKGAIQSSNDAETWTAIADLPGGENKEDVIEFEKEIRSRYVRLSLSEAKGGNPYILSEMKVFGKGGLVASPRPAPVEKENKQFLSGGNWKLQRASLVASKGEDISTESFKDENWIPATVPGTVLSSLLNIGAIPDPNFADNQLQISDSYFTSDFWYRNEFTVINPAQFATLNFRGINWKANVFLNGEKVGRIEGAFMRGKFDVSKQLVKGKNVIAVQIIKNAHPGAIKEQTAYSTDQNGGIPGADNPTFHASIGWDWIPTIRGRNIGIWNDVFLAYSGAVIIEDPFVRTELPLPDTSSADVFVELTLKNSADMPIDGILKGTFGNAAFEQTVKLAPKEEKLVKIDPKTAPALHLENPKLWWPKGYGQPNLYDVALSFNIDGKTSDKTEFKSGVRQMTFSEDVYQPSGGMSFGFFEQAKPTRLSIFVNGRRLVGFGGNWGFGESNLNYRGREYDVAVAYHADMNFTMIRNWVGQIGDEEFYEACDRHGVMVWQDFWLANPVDGPNPYYVDMFNDNAKDYIRRIRNHPSVGIYVGRNEGNPPPEIDDYLRKVVPEEHHGLYYISNSAMGIVSGGGTYRAMPPKEYFRLYGHDKLHSERGMPNVMNYESLLLAFGKDGVEPVNTMETPNSLYGLHDYTLGGGRGASAQAADSFNKIIEKAFGKPKDAKQFAEWAQWINYNGYRAIFESRSEHRRGMLLWMSHPAWPSMVWQTYDYYFDPNGGYFGCKKACEPVHIQWNPIRDDVEVVNYKGFDRINLVAKAQILNQDGSVQWENELIFDIKEDQTVACFPLHFPEILSATHFIKLTLTQNGKLISDNFYWRGQEDGNYKSLLSVPKVKLTENTTIQKEGSKWLFTTTLKNETNDPAMMIRLKAIKSESGEMIVPVFYSDNYFFLMPGEEKTVTIELQNADTNGESPALELSGFNLM
jgi:hypothetical protein